MHAISKLMYTNDIVALLLKKRQGGKTSKSSLDFKVFTYIIWLLLVAEELMYEECRREVILCRVILQV